MLNSTPARIRLIINGTECLVPIDGNPISVAGNQGPAAGKRVPAAGKHVPVAGKLEVSRTFPDRPGLPPAPTEPLLPLKWRDPEDADSAAPSSARQSAFSRRTALVSVDVVRAVLGVDAITVAAMVDAGDLTWVFDVSATKSSQRELRFWTRELFEPELCRMSPARALQMIMGKSRQRWRGTEIEQLLLASRASIFRWNRAGDLPGETVDHTFWATREALADFLKSRLCHRGEKE